MACATETCLACGNLPPFAHESSIVSRLKAHFGLSDLLKRLVLGERVEHGFAEPINNRRAGDLRELALANSNESLLSKSFVSLIGWRKRKWYSL